MLYLSSKTSQYSAETRAKMRTSQLGKKQSPELVKKRAASIRAAHAARRLGVAGAPQ